MIRNQRLNAKRVNIGGFMTGPGTADAAVILNSNQQPPVALAAPVRQANHRFDQVAVG